MWNFKNLDCQAMSVFSSSVLWGDVAAAVVCPAFWLPYQWEPHPDDVILRTGTSGTYWYLAKTILSNDMLTVWNWVDSPGLSFACQVPFSLRVLIHLLGNIAAGRKSTWAMRLLARRFSICQLLCRNQSPATIRFHEAPLLHCLSSC